MSAVWRGALAQLRAGRRRTLLAAAGILAAAAMAGAAVLLAYGLDTGFDRSANRADLPDVIARFSPERPARVAALLRALPNVESYTLRLGFDRLRLAAGTHDSDRGSAQLVGPGRRGYAIVAGADVSASRPGVVIERGLADDWGLHVGDDLDVDAFGALRVTGIAVAPDNVAFPLASAPRIYLSQPWVEQRFGRRVGRVDQALVWARDPARTDITLQQARATAYGIEDLRFVTRSGVRVLIDQAAGIVIALLVSFGLIALGAAAAMLAAQSAADVQRRVAVIGVQRALGVPRGLLAAQHATAAGLVALVAGAAGVALGALVVAGPSAGLLHALNEQSPGAAALGPLAAALAAIVVLASTAAAWPAWRAAGRAPVALLRGGGDLGRRPRRARGAGGGGARRRAAGLLRPGGLFAGRRAAPARPGGFLLLGARLALARRGRALAAIVVLAASAAVIMLMLGLASLLTALRDDPGSVGKRYQLTARLPAALTPQVRAIPGVADASPRYVVRGADSYALGEPVKLLGFPGDHTRFEDPPLADGRRVRGEDEAEVGTGLAAALGVRVGGRLAVQLPSGAEVRYRVVGTVRALDDDGRIAYVRSRRLLAAQPGLPAETVIRLRKDADRGAVSAALGDLGARPVAVGGATTRNGAFLGTLAGVLRAVAGIDALVCLYALLQSLALTARDRRPTLAVLRAAGAGRGTLARVLAGAALALALPAALLAAATEHWALAPLVGQLAAGYADLGTGASLPQAAAVTAALCALALLAAARVARRTAAEPPVIGLREE